MAQPWHNWARTVSVTPQQLAYPSSESEIMQLVLSAESEGLHIRAVGAGHSFTPVAASSDIMLSLDHLQGIENYDPDSGEVTVWAGTRLHQLGRLLHELGRAQENLGDIDQQSVAGAISTGTHGTGLHFGSIGTQVTGLRLIDGRGQLRTIDASQPDQLAAARLSLGALGIITSVTLKTQSAFKLRQDIHKATFAEMLHLWPEYAQGSRHFEFFWIPHTDTVQLKRSFLSEEEATGRNASDFVNETVLENGALWALSEVNARFPRLTKSVASTIGLGVAGSRKVRASHEVFSTQRLVRFKEMEYGVPLASLGSVLKDLRAMFEAQQLPISFPIEVRLVRGDDIYLSTAQGGDRAYIAVHAYHRARHQDYFREAESIFRAHAGRPHWGKMHSLGAAQLQDLYPHFHDFKAVQNEFDPLRRFGSHYLQHLLGK